MTSVQDLVGDMIRRFSTPQFPMVRGEQSPFPLQCTFSSQPADEDELLPVHVEGTEGLREFWRIARSAELFQDLQYGQWGLTILSPSDALRETLRQAKSNVPDHQDGDLIFGTFRGDPDFLLATKEGRILVGLPMEARREWPLAGESFLAFLDSYVKSNGDKYWETQSGGVASVPVGSGTS